jgi:hypothetical protein
MSKNRKISNQEFEYLLSIPPYTTKSNKKDHAELKDRLLRSVENAFQDKWYNLKSATRVAIDYICFLSVERGFVYASPDHIAEKHGIARSTVYDAIKLLRDNGVLYKANRSSRKQNGLGCAIYFFIEHPLFPLINDFLNLDWKAEENTKQKPQNPEITCQTRDSGVRKSSTYNLSFNSPNSKNRDIQSTVDQSVSISFVKYVPKEINALYANVFGERLRSVWQKITQAWKSINQSVLKRGDLITIGLGVVKRLFQHWKKHQHQCDDMTLDEMCAFAYKCARESFYHALGTLYMEDIPAEMLRPKADKPQSKKKPNIEPPFMEEHLRRKEARQKQLREATAAIPELESSYLSNRVGANLHEIIESVMAVIRERYKELDRHDLSSIKDNYLSHTAQKHLVAEYQKQERERILEMIKSIKGTA